MDWQTIKNEWPAVKSARWVIIVVGVGTSAAGFGAARLLDGSEISEANADRDLARNCRQSGSELPACPVINGKTIEHTTVKTVEKLVPTPDPAQTLTIQDLQKQVQKLTDDNKKLAARPIYSPVPPPQQPVISRPVAQAQSAPTPVSPAQQGLDYWIARERFLQRQQPLLVEPSQELDSAIDRLTDKYTNPDSVAAKNARPNSFNGLNDKGQPEYQIEQRILPQLALLINQTFSITVDAELRQDPTSEQLSLLTAPNENKIQDEQARRRYVFLYVKYNLARQAVKKYQQQLTGELSGLNYNIITAGGKIQRVTPP